ncbi:MAG: hypothetical protein ACRDFT_09975 [bacterium]
MKPKWMGPLTLAILAAVVVYGGMVSAAGMMVKRVTLAPTPLAKNAGLAGATGSAVLDIDAGTVAITVTLAAGTRVPAGSVLEGWLVDAGRKGGPGMSHASEKDQRYGAAFGDASIAALSRDLPYALSTGVLKLRAGSTRTYVGTFKIANTLVPYNAVVVTLESDGNAGAYDPRPGTPVLAGEIAK